MRWTSFEESMHDYPASSIEFRILDSSGSYATTLQLFICWHIHIDKKNR